MIEKLIHMHFLAKLATIAILIVIAGYYRRKYKWWKFHRAIKKIAKKQYDKETKDDLLELSDMAKQAMKDEKLINTGDE